MQYINETCFNLLSFHEKRILSNVGVFTYNDFVDYITSCPDRFRRLVGGDLFRLLTVPDRYCVFDYIQLSFFDEENS